MPHCHGLRARTRSLFSKAFRKHGVTPLSKYLVSYRKGDYVDILADGAIHRGMPAKFYHGKTGRVFNVTQHALGVICNKRVGNRILPKRIHVRVEHVRMSSCREAFKARVRANDKAKRDAKAAGKRVDVKRANVQPRVSQVIDTSKTTIEFMNPVKFRELY
jgi:large subunit ribosomal protein L21e